MPMPTTVKDDKPVTVLHVPFEPSGNPAPALDANSKVGATEIGYLYFPVDSDRDAIMSSVDKFRPVLARSEALAVYNGWALEEVQMRRRKAESFSISWAGLMSKHMRFSNSDDFKKNVHHLLGIKTVRHTESYHITLSAV
ncbi:MAG: hypothetical protein Q9187_007183 [Circinaria calcarea]